MFNELIRDPQPFHSCTVSILNHEFYDSTTEATLKAAVFNSDYLFVFTKNVME